MSVTSDTPNASRSTAGFVQRFTTLGILALLIAIVAAGFFFADGLGALAKAWRLPEYSHGPLIPILSLLLFLRQLKEVPVQHGQINDRWVGVVLLLLALMLGAFGHMATIADLSAYGLIVFVGAILLISFGWNTGKHFWPPVLHLVYMLPLPGVIYFKLTNSLQFISSELGVWFLQLLSIPVYLEGNIIDLGTLKLHVAEACSGLRYLFPIMSFSYIFAVLYRGSVWHKAVLLLAAVPITVLMNSVRIAIAGIIADRYGIEWLDGFTHFFEGWVIFLACIVLLFALARIMLLFQRPRMSLVDALDLNTDGLGTQAMRLQLVQASAAMVTAAVLMVGATVALQMFPDTRGKDVIDRDPFSVFPRALDAGWIQNGPPQLLDPNVERILGADDYLSISMTQGTGEPDVGLFMAWYRNQSDGGVHSPEVCLPGAGWEIAWLERSDIAAQLGSDKAFKINRAIIQRGETRMMVYYWFDQRGRKIAWDFAARLYLLVDGILTGRVDGGLVRLTTAILPHETDAEAEARLNSLLKEVAKPLHRFMPQE